MHADSPQPRPPLRALLLDDHEISRAAWRALLRTEGVDVVADLPLGEDAVATTDRLSPDVVVVDLTPGDEVALAIARRVRALACAPSVILTSSADPARFVSCLEGMPFIAKAELCAGQILALLTRRSNQCAPFHIPTTPRGGY